MRMLLSAIGLLALSSSVQAFTNGTLIPSYICGPPNDGYPKSAATLIPYLQLQIDGDTYNQFPAGTGTTAIAVDTAPTSRDIVGAFHNGLPTNYQAATTNAVWISPYPITLETGLPFAGGPDYVITPGKVHSFMIATNCPVTTAFTNANFGGQADQNLAGFNNPNVALDGAMLYALDTATNKRIGRWLHVGPTMTNFTACTLGGQYDVAVGIVHNQLITDQSNLANLTWQAPDTIVGTVKFIGVGVTDCGYGPIAVEYNVSSVGSNTLNNGTGNWTAASPVNQGLNSQTAANIATLQAGGATFAANLATVSAVLPQTLGTSTATAATTTMYSQAATVGVAVGSAIGGALLAGGIVFLVTRKTSSSSNYLAM